MVLKKVPPTLRRYKTTLQIFIKAARKGKVARYNKIHKHVTKQYTKLKTFLEDHTEEDYQDLAKRIPFDEYITQMTDFYASQGLLP